MKNKDRPKPDVVRFTYWRDKHKKPRVVSCLLRFGEVWCRGVSLCSLKDNPVMATGKNKAIGRAYKAWFRKDSSLPINRDEAIEVLDSVLARSVPSWAIVNKSTFAVAPSDLEIVGVQEA